MPISNHGDDMPVISKDQHSSAKESSQSGSIETLTQEKNLEKNEAEVYDTPEDTDKSEVEPEEEVNMEHKKRAQLMKDQEAELEQLFASFESPIRANPALFSDNS